MDIAGHVLRDEERARIGRLDSITEREEVLLRFSAKEALYKALYPQTLQFQGFGAAKLTKVSAPSAQFQIELTCDWSDAYRAGTQFNGWFQFLANTVVTVIADGSFA